MSYYCMNKTRYQTFHTNPNDENKKKRSYIVNYKKYILVSDSEESVRTLSSTLEPSPRSTENKM